MANFGLRNKPEILFVRTIVERDRGALLFTLLACTITSLVAIFQFAVFTSFLGAAAVVPRLLAATAWITAPGVPAFDFPYLVSEDYGALVVRCFPGASTKRIAFGFTQWTSSTGTRGNLALVGIDGSNIAPRHFVVDQSDKERLELTGNLDQVEIGGISMTLASLDNRLPTFLGVPYALLTYRDAVSAMNFPPDRASFIAIRGASSDPTVVRQQVRCAKLAFPEISVMTGPEFALKSSLYWMLKTGAGAAVLLGALLASILYLILLTNGVSRFLQRRHRDFVSMLGVGTDVITINRIMLYVVGILSGGSLLAAFLVLPIVDVGSEWILPWVELKPVDVAFALCISLLGSTIGIYVARADIGRLKLADVFRV